MIVATPSGPVAGRETGTPGGSVAQVLGVPYADAPGASARFRVAAPAGAHREVLDATTPGPVVPHRSIPFAEDQRLEPVGADAGVDQDHRLAVTANVVLELDAVKACALHTGHLPDATP